MSNYNFIEKPQGKMVFDSAQNKWVFQEPSPEAVAAYNLANPPLLPASTKTTTYPFTIVDAIPTKEQMKKVE